MTTDRSYFRFVEQPLSLICLLPDLLELALQSRLELLGQIRQVIDTDILCRTGGRQNDGRMRLLPDAILVEINNVRSILDLGVLLLLCIHSKHERKRGVSVAKVPQRQVRDVQVADVLVLEREHQAAERLTTVDKLIAVRTDEHVAGLEEDALKDAHDVVDFEMLKKASDRLVVDIWKLIETWHTELDYLVLRLVVLWVRVRQV